MNSPSDTISTSEPEPLAPSLPPEFYASRLLSSKIELAEEIDKLLASWAPELPAMKGAASYPVIDKELSLLMMCYNLALRLDAAIARIETLEAANELGTDDGK